MLAQRPLIRAVWCVQRRKVQVAAVAAQDDVRAGDGVEDDFLTAVLGLADKAKHPPSRSRAVGFSDQRALTERTCNRDALEALLDGRLRLVISDIPPWFQTMRRRKSYKTPDTRQLVFRRRLAHRLTESVRHGLRSHRCIGCSPPRLKVWYA